MGKSKMGQGIHNVIGRMRNKGNNCNTNNYYYYCHNKNIHHNKVELIFKISVITVHHK